MGFLCKIANATQPVGSAVKIRTMQAAERALKILNQKTEKDKQAGDGTSGLTREIFDWQTLADFASLGTRELAENIVTTRALKKRPEANG